jgi:hypothetical protein
MRAAEKQQDRASPGSWPVWQDTVDAPSVAAKLVDRTGRSSSHYGVANAPFEQMLCCYLDNLSKPGKHGRRNGPNVCDIILSYLDGMSELEAEIPPRELVPSRLRSWEGATRTAINLKWVPRQIKAEYLDFHPTIHALTCVSPEVFMHSLIFSMDAKAQKTYAEHVRLHHAVDTGRMRLVDYEMCGLDGMQRPLDYEPFGLRTNEYAWFAALEDMQLFDARKLLRDVVDSQKSTNPEEATEA